MLLLSFARALWFSYEWFDRSCFCVYLLDSIQYNAMQYNSSHKIRLHSVCFKYTTIIMVVMVAAIFCCIKHFKIYNLSVIYLIMLLDLNVYFSADTKLKICLDLYVFCVCSRKMPYGLSPSSVTNHGFNEFTQTHI